jgi:hypothetical protein
MPTWRIDKLTVWDRVQFLGGILGGLYIIGFGHTLTVACTVRAVQEDE